MQENLPFLANLDHYLVLGTYILIGLGFLILLYHEFKVMVIKDPKEKYDYVNLHEIKYFWYAVIAFIGAGALYANTIASETITESGHMIWFYVRLFIVASGATIFYFTFSSIVKIYYPRYLEKRLHKLRIKPRVSDAGNVMKRLSEEEEDAYLTESQIAEEAGIGGDGVIHSVDYDVWLDEKTGQTRVERYLSYQHSEECPECGYYTLKISKEELEVQPTETQEGLLLKHYKCDYCKHRELREEKLPMVRSRVSQ
jgi:hypothetical protein